MNETKEFQCRDGKSVFRVEKTGRIRLILMPEDRPILQGQWNEKKGLLLLYKSRMNVNKASYTFAVPSELWENLQNINVVAIHVRENDRYYCVLRSKLEMFGYEDDLAVRGQRHGYLFLDVENWTQVGTLEDVLEFELEHRRPLRPPLICV